MSDIGERLRETIAAHDVWYQGRLKTSDTLLERLIRERKEAANTIEALRAENARLLDCYKGSTYTVDVLIKDNARLRELLKPFAHEVKFIGDDEPDHALWANNVTVGHFRAARAATGESDE